MLTNGGRNPFPLLNPNRPQVDFSGAKTDYQSEMMRRDINGKVDGNGIKMGQAVETGVTIIAPIVVGGAIAPKAAPQSLKTLGGIPEVEAAQTINAAQQISKLKVPQGMTEPQFAEFSQTIRQSKAAEYGSDIRVHGSRAAGTAKETSDIDVAIRVSEEKFNQILKEVFKKVKQGSGSSAEKTMLYAIESRKIRRGDASLSSVGNSLAKEFGFKKVDISIIKEGSVFDQGSWIPLK